MGDIRQVVRGYIFDEAGKVLMVRHREDGRWVLPGGHLEEGESIFQGLQREIKEEFNLDIEIFGEVNDIEGLYDEEILQRQEIHEFPLPVCINTVKYDHKKYGTVHKLEYMFFADVVGGELKVQTDEIYEYRWFSIDDVLEMDVNKDTYVHISHVLYRHLDLLDN